MFKLRNDVVNNIRYPLTCSVIIILPSISSSRLVIVIPEVYNAHQSRSLRDFLRICVYYYKLVMDSLHVYIYVGYKKDNTYHSFSKPAMCIKVKSSSNGGWLVTVMILI